MSAPEQEHEPDVAAPSVLLGVLTDESIAASVYVLVRHGVILRPGLAGELRGTVVLRFVDDYSPVRIDFRGDEIHVEDLREEEDRAHDLEIVGRLGDVNSLIAAPLAGGLPKPLSPRGRAALARLADGRVDFIGPLGLARKVLMLLAVDAEASADTRRARREREARSAGPAG
ncbi:hypothetical protein NBH00_09355 [Paraconexibacter antarcticus]|uniref:SCP2 domain-containing protein n=1 Tax=Paraconexibacter antarcticus TaxID=2949664 RepID=A0ABY5DWL3_9ACTN|nr:hypothetical protein [Paraconexibacter antarcticus]UTI66398.1 hypothetical protein NBH00_09355 [Paraconexibacter antarcticus]